MKWSLNEEILGWFNHNLKARYKILQQPSIFNFFYLRLCFQKFKFKQIHIQEFLNLSYLTFLNPN